MRRQRTLGGALHPYYRNILLRSLALGHDLPTYDCQRIQEKLVRDLVDGFVWERLDYLYIHAVVGAYNGFTDLNWIQPMNAVSSNSGIVFVPKKGIHSGTVNYGYDQATNRLKMGGGIPNTNSNDASIFVMLGLAAGAITVIEELHHMSGANGFHHAMRLRVAPRVDYLFNVPGSNPQTMQNSLPTAQRLYTAETGMATAGVGHSYTWYDGAMQTDASGSGTGVIPNTGPLQTFGIIPGRALALIGGGGALTYFNTAFINRVPALNTAIQNYMNALNLLS